MNLLTDLQTLGLSDKEARTYLTLLEKGQLTIQQISTASGVKRATVYTILESLAKQGLVSSFAQGKKTFFIATDPNSLSILLETKLQDISKQQFHLKEILPNLLAAQFQGSDKPVVKFFEGKSGLISCLQEYFSQVSPHDNQAWSIFNQDMLREIFTESDFAYFRELRIKQNAKVNAISNDSNPASGPAPVNLNKVVLDYNLYPFSCDIGIYGNMIRIISLGKKPLAILITDTNLANSFQSIAKLAWMGAQMASKQ